METTASLKELGLSVIRTIVPVIVGYLIAQAARFGWDIDHGDLTALVTALVITIYYLVVRILETHVWPKFGWLLGAPKPPTY